MAAKPKAGRPKKAAKQKKMTQAEQSARFIKTARELGADDLGKFEKAIRIIVPPRRGRRVESEP
jgi:hypothetical protein